MGYQGQKGQLSPGYNVREMCESSTDDLRESAILRSIENIVLRCIIAIYWHEDLRLEISSLG